MLTLATPGRLIEGLEEGFQAPIPRRDLGPVQIKLGRLTVGLPGDLLRLGQVKLGRVFFLLQQRERF